MDDNSINNQTTNNSLQNIISDLTNPIKRNPIGNKIWVTFLVLVIIAGLVAYGYQIKTGLGVTAMRDYSSWGMYIGHFVFLVAVSLVGSLVTAILKLTGQKWATPVTRISEIIAVAAVALAGLTIIVDMGHPDRALNLFLHGRFASPILWDVTVVTTYLVISVILLFLPLIPDIAILRDHYTDAPKWKKKVYNILSLGWKGTEEQYKLLKKSIRIMMVLIMPVALAIHTVTSWLFAATLRTGWNSTIFGPYFVAGAFMAGAAAVIIAMYFFNKNYKLQKYLLPKHFDMMAKLLVLTSLVYLYFNINEYIMPYYKMMQLDRDHLNELFSGEESILFWSVQIFGMFIPIILLLFKKMRTPLPMMIISVFVVIGAWLKRMIIVIPTQFHPTFPIQNVPENFHHYDPTLIEITITSATVAMVLLIITLFVRLFPILPIWEIAHESGHHDIEKEGQK